MSKICFSCAHYNSVVIYTQNTGKKDTGKREYCFPTIAVLTEKYSQINILRVLCNNNTIFINALRKTEPF